jgi:spermidine/putrescine transport system permease protein
VTAPARAGAPIRSGSTRLRDSGRRAGRLERLGDRLVRGYALGAYLFLFVPIVVVVVFSFNDGRHAADMKGISLRWYGSAWSNRFVLDALRTSLTIAAVSALIATVLGTSSALAMDSLGRRSRAVFEQLTYIAIIVPGIVIGIATLIFLVTLFGWLNPWLAYVLGDGAPRLGLGIGSIIAGHSLFTLALVNVLVRTRLRGMDRSLIEASNDLYAGPVRTFAQVTLPQLLPAILAGGLLAFTFSFDDFIIAFFTSGKEQTIPIYLFASIRRGVTPEVNAIATVLLATTLSVMLLAGLLLRRRARTDRASLDLVAGTADDRGSGS